MNALSRAWDGLRAALPGLWDIHLYGGAALVVWGISRLHEPSAWIFGGAFLISVALWRLHRMERAGSR